MFPPLQPQSLPNDCARRIRRAILRGEIPAGERLPTERALAEQLGVNRVTVRAALGSLVSAGLLEVRQGRGYTVLDFRESGGPQLIGALESPLPELARDLFLVRRHLATAVLERLAERAFDPAPILQAIADFGAAVDADIPVDELALADAAILQALLAATGSPVLQLSLNPIRQVLTQLPALCDAMYREPSANVAGWQALGRWIQAPTAPAIPAIQALLEARDAATVAALEAA